MKKKKTAFLALAVAGVMTAGMLSGCSLITTDAHKDYMQTIATVDISGSSAFEANGEFASLGGAIEPSDILKRDLIASFVSSGYSAMNSYGWSYKQTFDAISKSLVNRQLTIQYAVAYLLKNGTDALGEMQYSVEGYNAAVKDTTGNAKKLAGLQYFLSEAEQNQGLYSCRKSFNNALDSQEKKYIKSEDDGTSSSSATVRTLPKNVNTENEGYYDPAYKIYTGFNSASDCGGYEAVKGSTTTTRKKAYNSYIAGLRESQLLAEKEDPTDLESLAYFTEQRISSYETILINKLTKLFEKEAAETLSEAYMNDYYDKLYASQSEAFKAEGGAATFEESLDKMAADNFLLTAPAQNYGYVINILLPFSASQSAAVSALNTDYGDKKGNAFAQRAKILEKVKATDQRGTWFTGETDYSYLATDAFTNADENRSKYLFFEDALKSEGESAQYEPLKNYYGKYSYNGQVHYDEENKKYTLSPKKISIDDFIGEMTNYLAFAGFTCVADSSLATSDYYNQAPEDYYKTVDGALKVDYSKFLYYAGYVQELRDSFDANNLFVAGTKENTAFSIINELSFAYNTDTAGLNSYLGYSVVTGKTSFVSEFEYAAQEACRMGAGSYTVAPSQYGWHIMYCTFSFVESNGEIRPFTFNYNDINREGSFSNLLYESVKSTIVENYSSNMQKTIVGEYTSCATVYEDRYTELANELDENAKQNNQAG